MAALTIASIIASLLPLLIKGGSAAASYFSGKGQGAQGTPQGGTGIDALGDLRGQQPSVTEMPDGGKLTQFSQQNPQQQQLLSQLLEQLKGQLGQGGEDPIADQARKQFKEVRLPELLERFVAQGSTLQGGGVRDAILRAQTDLEGNLAGRQYSMLQNLLGGALQPQQGQYLTPLPPKEPSGIMKALGIFGSPILQGVGSNLSAAFQAKYGL